MIRVVILLLAAFLVPGQQAVDPALRAVVERFFETQAAEDAEAYLALWSRTAQRPQAAQLKYIFDSGDDKFLDLEITRAIVEGGTARVRVAVTRVRTSPAGTNPDGSRRMFSSRLLLSLALVLEDGAWKLVREGAPSDELADALIASDDPAIRAELLKADGDLLTFRLVDALSRRADALARAMQYKGALAIYERALEAARAAADRKAEGEMLQNIANSYYFLRQFEPALANYEKRLALEREAANDDGIASALVGIATIRYSTYEYSAALALYREALTIQERLNDEATVATTLISTGNVYFLQGDFEAAIADYRRAEGLKRKYSDFGGAASALEGLGRTYAAQGDYPAALIAFSGLLDESRTRRDIRREASALQNIGDTHFRLANLDAARTAYDESRQRYEKTGDLANAGRVWQGTAVAELLSGRFPAAESAYGKSQATCAAVVPEPDAECVARALVGLGFAQAAQERYDAAIASYRKSIDAFGKLKAPEAAGRAVVGLAEALSGKEDYEAALAEAVNARRIAVVLDADDLLWRALVAQARAQRKLGKKEEALGAARAALTAVQHMAAVSLDRPGTAVPRDTATAYATAAVLYAESGDAERAWTAAEEMRAHALRTALAANERDIARGMSDGDRASERTMAAELNALFVQRDREKALPKPDARRLERLDGAIRDATTKRTEAQKRLFDRLPDLRVWRGLAHAATLDEIRRVAEPGTLLVQFVLDERDLLILTAERSAEDATLSAHVVNVRRQAVAERVARAIEPAALSNPEAWRIASADVVKLLPPAVLSQFMSAQRIVVIPDDVLWRIPFEALPLGAGSSGDRAIVTYAPSVTSIVRAPSSASSPSPFQVAIVAAPTLSPSVVESLKTTAPSWTLRPAETGDAEAVKVQSALAEGSSTLIARVDATEQAVRASAARASVLHLAAPVRFNAASPLFSPMLLAPAGAMAEAPPANNGILEAREIPNTELVARLAVVSDPAALSMREAGGALQAIQWVWRAGGVETLIVRRWTSDESATAEMLRQFYERLSAGASPSEAMESARGAARKAGAPPAVWAGWLVLSEK
jgi:tetratricopeptide (TPR) repeat protein/CHAT domain-containing protein